MKRTKLTLTRNKHGSPQFPSDLPEDPEELLDLMDDASLYAGTAQGATAPAFDHGVRLFNQLYAHYQIRVAKQLGAAHQGLERATHALKVATWWLAAVTVALGIVELAKLFRGH